MIERHSRVEKAILFFMMGIAVAILSVGSLINFHQYKIWHKPLIPKLIGYKRDNEKMTKVVLLTKTFKENNLINKIASDPSSVLTEQSIFFPLFYNVLDNHFTGTTILSRVFSSAGLRGPPVC